MPDFTNTSDLLAAQIKRVEDLKKNNKGLQIAATTVHNMKVKRIFVFGLNCNGNKIGRYNTTNEGYISPKKLPRKSPPKGKHGQTRFKSGKPHKLVYYRSYSSLRASQGRQSSFMDFTFTNNLKSDFSKAPRRKNAQEYEEGTTRSFNTKKWRGLEQRFNNRIFTCITKGERDTFFRLMNADRDKLGI